MAPTIHIIRHAQAVQNLIDHPIPNTNFLLDPELTEIGYQQCSSLASQLASLGDIELVFASPMQRSIQTALATFGAYTQSKRIVLLPDLKECTLLPTSIGSCPKELLRKYGDKRFDFAFVTPEWTDNSPQSRYGPKFAAARGRSTRIFLRAVAQRYRDTDAHIVVITHGLYIGYLTNPPADSYGNAEYRSYYFDNSPDPRLVEKPCSIARREKAKYVTDFPEMSVLGPPACGSRTNAKPCGGQQKSCGGPGKVKVPAQDEKNKQWDDIAEDELKLSPITPFASSSNLPKKRNTDAPLLNPRNKKQKTSEPEAGPLFTWQKTTSNETTDESSMSDEPGDDNNGQKMLSQTLLDFHAIFDGPRNKKQ